MAGRPVDFARAVDHAVIIDVLKLESICDKASQDGALVLNQRLLQTV